MHLAALHAEKVQIPCQTTGLEILRFHTFRVNAEVIQSGAGCFGGKSAIWEGNCCCRMNTPHPHLWVHLSSSTGSACKSLLRGRGHLLIFARPLGANYFPWSGPGLPVEDDAHSGDRRLQRDRGLRQPRFSFLFSDFCE